MTTAAIEAGQAAWKRLQERPKATWQDWLVVGQALVVGRAEVMQEASTNRPFGLRYSRLMKKWLTQNGLNDINDQERYRVILCLENLSAIEKWRNDLPWAQRVRLNNPKAVWGRWKKSTTQPKPENRASRDAGSDIESRGRDAEGALCWSPPDSLGSRCHPAGGCRYPFILQHGFHRHGPQSLGSRRQG